MSFAANDAAGVGGAGSAGGAPPAPATGAANGGGIGDATGGAAAGRGRGRVGRPAVEGLVMTRAYASVRRQRERQKNLVETMQAEVAAKLAQVELLAVENDALSARERALRRAVADGAAVGAAVEAAALREQAEAAGADAAVERALSRCASASAGSVGGGGDGGNGACAGAGAPSRSGPSDSSNGGSAGIAGALTTASSAALTGNSAESRAVAAPAAAAATPTTTSSGGGGTTATTAPNTTAAAAAAEAAQEAAAAARRAREFAARYAAYARDVLARRTRPDGTVAAVPPGDPAVAEAAWLLDAVFAMPSAEAYALLSTNFATGAREAPPREAWGRAARALVLTPEQRARVLASWARFDAAMARLRDERAMLQAALAGMTLHLDEAAPPLASAAAAAAPSEGTRASSLAPEGGSPSTSAASAAAATTAAGDVLGAQAAGTGVSRLLGTDDHDDLARALADNLAREDQEWAIQSRTLTLMVEEHQIAAIAGAFWPFLPSMTTVIAAKIEEVGLGGAPLGGGGGSGGGGSGGGGAGSGANASGGGGGTSNSDSYYFTAGGGRLPPNGPQL